MPTRFAAFVLLATTAACVEPPPPPPTITVTSPQRGMAQDAAGQIVVTGTALPGLSGEPITSVSVNGTAATLAGDGSFTATVQVPPGAMLLETTAVADDGGRATDARAIQIGELRPVGTSIPKAVTATLSTDAFARLSTAAGPIIKGLDLPSLLAPMQPMVNLGDDLANLQLSITKLAFGDVTVSLTPVTGGLQFSATISALDVAATAAYGGSLVPGGTTSISASADALTVSGILVVTPSGTSGFTTSITSPTVKTTNLVLDASGLTGQILGLMQDNLGSAVQTIVASAAELAMQPLINDAFGALAGPQQVDVLGQKLDLQASPSGVTFTAAGALVTLDLTAKLEGSDASPGYVFTPNGTPTLDPGNGVQLAIADDLVNEMFAEIHALGLLDIKLQGDYGVFDAAEFNLTLPPMISANTPDGSLKLVLGDMIATISDHGQPIGSAAINAQIDLTILPGANPQQVALKFGKVDVFVNLLDGANPGPGGGGSAGGSGTPVSNQSSLGAADLAGAANAGIAVQLDSLSQFLVTVPVPSVAGVTLDSLALHADSGYVVVAGQVH